MSKYAIIEHYANHVVGEITKRDVERVFERLRALGWEEVVRCRDCEYAAHFFHHDDERWQCTNPYQEGDDVKPDAYCWRGERKESGE